MPTWLKILLFIFLMGLVLAGVAVFLGVRWIKSHEGDLREMGRKEQAEAVEWGRGKDADACIDEALRRSTACGQLEVMCQVKTSMFVDGCLNAATLPSDFCAKVPKQLNIVGSVKWQVEECARRGYPNDQRCTRLLTTIQKRCERR